MRSLVIGDTSQLSYYFPEEYVKISSRNIDIESLKSENWERVYICFGESRKFIDDIDLHDRVNFYETIKVIDSLKEVSKSMIVYSTCELWNQIDGKIDMSMSFNFFSTPYLQSKYKLSKYLMANKSKYYNVFILYPFNFNSPYRNSSFLFGKIFDSIINQKTIEIGDTYFYRDIIHPKFVVSESISATADKIVGSGRMVFVNDFIRDLYNHFNMKYEDYVIENINKYSEYEKRKEYYYSSNVNKYTYEMLLNDSLLDIKK